MIKYSGISAITVSLFMLTLGSMPSSFAGQVDSTLTVTLSCGLSVTDPTINWTNALDPTAGNTLDSTNPSDFAGTEPTVTNPGSNTASSNVFANVGTSSGGGYAGTTDTTTHILPQEISVDLTVDTPPSGPVAMDNGGGNTGIGQLDPAEVQTLQLVVDTSNIVGTPLTDTTWAATVVLSATCVLT